MKQQVVAIHGGTSFDTHEDYIHSLKTREISSQKLQECREWRFYLSQALGDSYEVLVPKMPNPTNAHYEEWCLWLNRCIEFIQDDTILIGHSLGGIFLAKYLSEHVFPTRIKATIFVAAPYNKTITFESLTDFALPQSLSKLKEQGGQIYLVHSKDDPVVGFAEVEKYSQVLTTAKKLIFDDKGHFHQESFPELVELIRSM